MDDRTPNHTSPTRQQGIHALHSRFLFGGFPGLKNRLTGEYVSYCEVKKMGF